MILEPDALLVEDGVYRWTLERRDRAWDNCFEAMHRELAAGAREARILVGVPGAGKSTLARALDGPDIVVFDAVFASADMRRIACKIAKKHGAVALCAWVDVPLAECIARNATRTADRRVPEASIRAMHAKLRKAPPSLADGFDIVAIVTG